MRPSDHLQRPDERTRSRVESAKRTELASSHNEISKVDRSLIPKQADMLSRSYSSAYAVCWWANGSVPRRPTPLQTPPTGWRIGASLTYRPLLVRRYWAD